jgi:hypothetical protein
VTKIGLEANGALGRVSVEFEKVGEYYSHAIWLLIDKERIPVFKSFEDLSALNIPCFTDLHRQDQVLLLTGAKGSCLWSMSVQLGELKPVTKSVQIRPDDFEFSSRYGLNANANVKVAQHHTCLFFDVACRVKEPVAKLGSEYLKSETFECLGTGRVRGLASQSINVRKHVWFGGNSAEKLFEFAPNPRCLVACKPYTNLRFYAPQATIDAYPATVQWSYAFWTM